MSDLDERLKEVWIFYPNKMTLLHEKCKRMPSFLSFRSLLGNDIIMHLMESLQFHWLDLGGIITITSVQYT